MIAALAARLAQLAALNQTTTYGELARDLGLSGGGTIARLTAALEATMAEDAATGAPFRAALVNARGTSLPARGFFETAARLGRPIEDQAEFTQKERATLHTLFGGPSNSPPC